MADSTSVVRTRFPCGPNAGSLADRYPNYDAIPYLKRVGSNAIQCGAAGYWYVDADLSARVRDDVDVATGVAVQVVDNVRQSAEDFLGGAGKFVLLGGLAYLVLNLTTRRR